MGAMHNRVIRKSADELGTSIDINCRVEVRRFKEEARGTVRWLGLCDDTPAMYLEMDKASDEYFKKMNEELRYYQPDGVHIPDGKMYITKLSGIDIIVEDVASENKYEDGDVVVENDKRRVPSYRNTNSHYQSLIFVMADKNMPAMSGYAKHKNDADSATNGATFAATQTGVIDDTPKESHNTGATGNGSQEQIPGPTEVMAAVINEMANLEICVNCRLDNMMKELSNECKLGRITEMKNRQDIEDIHNKVKELKNMEEEVRKSLKEEIKRREALERKHQRQVKDLETNETNMMLKINIFMIIIVSIAWCITGTNVHNPQTIQGVKTDAINDQSSVTTDELYEVMMKKRLSIFDSSMHNIQSNFPDEDARFWSSIAAPIHRIIQERNPSRPAVVLIATTRSYSNMAERSSREVALLIENLYDINDISDTYMTLEASHFNSLDPGEAKLQMDHGLSKNFQRRHIVAIIHDLGSLPATAASLLHAYCDHKSAHFKKAVLLATVYLEPGITLCNEEVEAYLSEVWQELEEDVLKYLISKFASNVAIMGNKNINM